MATTTIATVRYMCPGSININTPGVVLGAGDTLNLLATGGIVDYGPGFSPGVSGAGSNSLVVNGSIYSANASGIDLSAGGNDVNVGANVTVASAATFGFGISINGNNNSIGIAGTVAGLAAGIQVVGVSSTVNELAGGSIIGTNNGIFFFGAGGNLVTIAGDVTGWGNAAVIAGGGSNAVTITSTGHLFGYVGVSLGGGSGAN